jgi:hypothetical protein
MIRDWYDLTKGYLWSAAIIATFGVIFLIVVLQSSDLVIWTGRCVPASFRDGLAYYVVQGEQYVAGDPSLPDSPPRRVTVCYQPNAPDQGYIVHPAAYWAEGGVVGVPLAAAAIVLLIGVIRAARITSFGRPRSGGLPAQRT